LLGKKLHFIEAYITKNQSVYNDMIHYRVTFDDKQAAYAIPKSHLKYMTPAMIEGTITKEIAKLLIQTTNEYKNEQFT
jgi:hypothetical protein